MTALDKREAALCEMLGSELGVSVVQIELLLPFMERIERLMAEYMRDAVMRTYPVQSVMERCDRSARLVRLGAVSATHTSRTHC